MLAVGTLALTAVLPSAAVAGDALPGARQRWIRLESAHFTFFSSATDRSTRALARDLEELRSALEVLLPGAELKSPVATWIYVFEDRIDFAPYRPIFEGRSAQVDGYFLARRDGNFVALNGDSRTDPRRTVLHEYLHEVTRHNLPGLPLWLSEGLAEVYSTFRTRADGAGVVGLPHREHVGRLRRGPLVPLEELLTLGRGDRAYHRGGIREVVYAQSWALVHMFLFGERRIDFDRYLAALRSGENVEAAYERLLADRQAIEAELRRYVRGRYPGTEVPLTADARGTRDLAIEKMSHREVLWRLGTLLAHIGPAHFESARAHFLAVLAATSEGDTSEGDTSEGDTVEGDTVEGDTLESARDAEIARQARRALDALDRELARRAVRSEPINLKTERPRR